MLDAGCWMLNVLILVVLLLLFDVAKDVLAVDAWTVRGDIGCSQAVVAECTSRGRSDGNFRGGFAVVLRRLSFLIARCGVLLVRYRLRRLLCGRFLRCRFVF